MTHGGKHERNLLLVMSDVGGFGGNLGHQNHVTVTAILQGGDIAGQLIAEDEAQSVHDGPKTFGSSLVRLRRNSPLQRSEQVLTKSQSFAHFFRHENGRPHWAQVFCGISAL